MLNKYFHTTNSIILSSFVLTYFLVFPLTLSAYSLNDLKYKIGLNIIDENSILIKSITNAKEDIWNKQTFAATAKSNNGHYIFFGGGLYENTTSDRYKKRKSSNFIEELANSRNDIIIDRQKVYNETSQVLDCKKNIYVDWYEYIETDNTSSISKAGFDFTLCTFHYLVDIGMKKSILDKLTKAIQIKDSNFEFSQEEIKQISHYEKKLFSDYNIMTIYGIETFKKQNNIEYQLFNIETVYFYWRCVFMTKYKKNIIDTFFCINPSSGFNVDDNIEKISNLIID